MEANVSWVMEAEKMIRDGDGTDRSAEMARWSKHSIYRVPAYIKSRHSGSDAYRPQLVSLGPFHHGSADLVPMEAHKRRALAHRVRRSGKPLRAFAAAVGDVAEQLADAYEDLEPLWKANDDRGRFVELMVTDGCFLLEVLRMGVDDEMRKPPQQPQDYAPNDPVFSDHGFLYLSGTLRRDMLVMENQLPMLLLHTLLTVERGTPPSGKEMNFVVLDAMWSKHPDDMAAFSHDMALHVLDICHRLIGGDNNAASNNREPREDTEMHPVMPSAVKLHEAGIHFKEMDDVGLQLRGISFEGGVLGVPPTWFYGSIECEFLNLMAFERLHPNAGDHVTEYVYFMDNLIDSPDDVALLCAKGIVVNMLGSDQEVADLFNKVLSKEAVIGVSSRLHDVHHQVSVHCGKPWNRWRASLIHTYFSNPWVFVSLVAAVVLLVATLLQTVYTVVPLYRT